MVATDNQSVIMICSLFVPGTLPFFALSFPLSGNKKPPPAKSVGRPFHNESNPEITFVSDPINTVVESGISDESKLAIITSVPDPGSLLKNRLNQFRLQPLDVGG